MVYMLQALQLYPSDAITMYLEFVLAVLSAAKDTIAILLTINALTLRRACMKS